MPTYSPSEPSASVSGFLRDLRVLYHLAVQPIRGTTHSERLESFYSGQADSYDRFRRRLLPGRDELIRSIPFRDGDLWVDMGAGTGANQEAVAKILSRFRAVYLVDLAPSLLRVARRRCRERDWSNVKPVEADATQFAPPEGSASVVTFSYSLTMIPDWFAAIDNALRILQPGGVVAVVDFFVDRKYADARRPQGVLCRWFWRMWFSRDNVFLSPDHIPYLHTRFAAIEFAEGRARIPYLPGVRVPYYRFIGRKPTGRQAID